MISKCKEARRYKEAGAAEIEASLCHFPGGTQGKTRPSVKHASLWDLPHTEYGVVHLPQKFFAEVSSICFTYSMLISTVKKTSFSHSRHLQWACYKSWHPALNWSVKLKKICRPNPKCNFTYFAASCNVTFS